MENEKTSERTQQGNTVPFRAETAPTAARTVPLHQVAEVVADPAEPIAAGQQMPEAAHTVPVTEYKPSARETIPMVATHEELAAESFKHCPTTPREE